jgi:peptidoglycan/LPS O-acetylase OafA/YrhL
MKSRIASLDGIRALSIALVCMAHFSYSVGFPLPTMQKMWWVNDYARYGVGIFLVISGFLITTLLQKELIKTGAINLKQFYIRRAYRILPVAYLYMAVVTVLFYKSIQFKYLLAAYTYLSCYTMWSPWVLVHLWSLSVEEQFYLLWPATMVLGLVVARRFAAGEMIVAPVLRYVMSLSIIGLSWRTSHRLMLSSFPTVADSLAAGCLLALYQPELGRWARFFEWRGFPLIWAAILAIPIANHYEQPGHIGGLIHMSLPTVFNIGIALCLQNAVLVKPWVFNIKPVIWIGQLSYGLYLWQMLFTNPDAHSWMATFPQNIGFFLLTVVASYYLFEQPILRLRDTPKTGGTPPGRCESGMHKRVRTAP